MKKLLVSCFLIIAIIFTTIPVYANQSAPLGDVNLDGKISLDDAVLAIKCAAGIEDINDNIITFGDVDSDGKITTVDARYILRVAANIEPTVQLQFTDPEIITPSTCTTHGIAVSYSLTSGNAWTQQLPLGPHKEVAATCTEGAYCSVCFDVLSEPSGHTLNNGYCKNCGEQIHPASSIQFGSKKIPFGASLSSITKVFGSPQETLSDISNGKPVKYLVYSQDYSKLTIFTYSEDLGLVGVYSINPSFAVMVNGQTISYNNVENQYKIGDTYFESYKDNIGTKEIYAFYATNDRATMKIYPDSSFRTTEKIIYHLTNSCRAINGLSVLDYSSELHEVAYFHSLDMATNNFFSHNSYDGTIFIRRLDNFGIVHSGSGENIAAGSSVSAYDFNNMWYNSEGHRVVMLCEPLTHIGVGVAYDETSQYKFYATQDYITEAQNISN